MTSERNPDAADYIHIAGMSRPYLTLDNDRYKGTSLAFYQRKYGIVFIKLSGIRLLSHLLNMKGTEIVRKLLLVRWGIPNTLMA